MKHEIDFLAAYESQFQIKNHGNRRRMPLWQVFAILLGVNVLILAAVAGWLKLSSLKQEALSRELQDYVTISADAQRYTELQQMRSDLSAISAFNSAVEAAHGIIENRPEMNMQVYHALTENMPQGVRMLKFQFNESELSVNMVASDAALVPNYIETIRNCGTFSQVSYAGWSSLSIQAGMEDSGGYYFTVQCVIKGVTEG